MAAARDYGEPIEHSTELLGKGGEKIVLNTSKVLSLKMVRGFSIGH